MKATLNIPALERLIDDNRKAIDDLDATAVECVRVGLNIQRAAIEEGLDRHRWTGKALEGIHVNPVERNGNVVSGTLGQYFGLDKEAFMHALYQEYGSPTFKADPWLRPAIDSTKPLIRKVWRGIIKKHTGVTTK